MLPASNENEISKNVINNTYIGVPPKAPKEYLTTPHFPNYFEYELFKMEDERYHLDSNILKYRAIIQTLDQIIADEDSSRRTLRIAKLSKSYVNYANFLTEKKVVKQKLEVSEIEDEIEKLKAIQSDISHDVNLITK